MLCVPFSLPWQSVDKAWIVWSTACMPTSLQECRQNNRGLLLVPIILLWPFLRQWLTSMHYTAYALGSIKSSDPVWDPVLARSSTLLQTKVQLLWGWTAALLFEMPLQSACAWQQKCSKKDAAENCQRHRFYSDDPPNIRSSFLKHPWSGVLS